MKLPLKADAKTLYEFINHHHSVKKEDHCRLGQRFVIAYVKQWPELFYERDDDRSLEMIMRYLEDLHYLQEDVYYLPPMPPEVKQWLEEYPITVAKAKHSSDSK